MNTNDNKVKNYSDVLDTKYGADGMQNALYLNKKRMIFIQAWCCIKREKKQK